MNSFEDAPLSESDMDSPSHSVHQPGFQQQAASQLQSASEPRAGFHHAHSGFADDDEPELDGMGMFDE